MEINTDSLDPGYVYFLYFNLCFNLLREEMYCFTNRNSFSNTSLFISSKHLD